VGIGAEYINSIIDRIEDLVLTVQSQKPVAGNNIQINYTDKGAVINAVVE
jgi:spore germination protein GerM